MSKRRREKHDINHNLTREDQQLGSAKKMKVLSRNLRSRRHNTQRDGSGASSSYISPECRSKLQSGRSPVCSTPRASRHRLNASHSESETEIIWDGNSPTAHLQRRIGRSGRSRAGDIAEIVQCVENQTEDDDSGQTDMPLLGLWMNRPVVPRGSDAAAQQESSKTKASHPKKASHRKAAGRLSLLQAELEKIANAINMASVHATPPTCSREAGSPRTKPGQVHVEQPVSHCQTTSSPSVTAKSSGGQSAPGQLKEEIWDDESWDDDLLIEKLTKVETIEMDKKQTSQILPASLDPSLVQSQNAAAQVKPDPESNVKMEQPTLVKGTVAKPSPATNVARNQRQLPNEKVKHTLPTGKQKPQGQFVNHQLSVKQVAVNPVSAATKPSQSITSESLSSKRIQTVQHVPDTATRHQVTASSTLQTNPPVTRHEMEKHGGSNTRSSQPKSQAVNNEQIRPSTSSKGPVKIIANSTTSTSQKRLPSTTTGPNMVIGKDSQKCGSTNAPLTAEEADWDSLDLFESSLTDEMMMSLCAGMDSPQAKKTPEQGPPVGDAQTGVSAMGNTAQSVSILNNSSAKQQKELNSSTQTQQQNDKLNSLCKPNAQKTGNSYTGSCTNTLGTNTFTFRKPVKDVSNTVNQIVRKTPLVKTTATVSVSGTIPPAKANPVQPQGVPNRQPVSSSARFPPAKPPPATNQPPRPSRQIVPSSMARPTIQTNANANTTANMPPSNGERRTFSFSSRPASVGPSNNKPGLAGAHQNMNTPPLHPKPAVDLAHKGSSQRVCSQMEIERKRQLAMARRQQHRTNSQLHMSKQR